MSEMAFPTADILAAGVLFICDGKALLMQRGAGGDAAGQWAFPGGKIEPGETARQAAAREVSEETGFQIDPDALMEHCRRVRDGVDFTTFVVNLAEPFDPVLNEEHGAFVWTTEGELPAHMHPGATIALDKLKMHELDIAKAIRGGDLASPIRYRNVWLFDLRITGTGAAYRDSLDEYAWRDPSLYLNDDFLGRCNGLAVIWEHPEKTMLNTVEWRTRAIGAFMLPYIKGEEVWGVARIYDEDAAFMMSPPFQMSTSPGVVLRGGTPARYETLEDGTRVLVETDPALLDHLAVCEAGVWDKADTPRGVNNSGDQIVTDEERAAEEKSKADAARADAAKKDADAGTQLKTEILDAVGKMLGDAMGKFDAKLDSMKADASKKDECGDEEEKAKAEKMASDKKDAEDKAKADKAKKDSDDEAESEKEKEKEKLEAELKELKDSNSALKAKFDAIDEKMKDRSDSDEAEMADAQARADSVMTKLGDGRAPRPLHGESVVGYRRRLLAPYAKFSSDWKEADLAKVDSVTFKIAEKQIWDAASQESVNPDRFTPGTLHAITQQMAGGHTINEYKGQPRDWMDGLAGHTRQHAVGTISALN